MSALLRRFDDHSFAHLSERKLRGALSLTAIAGCYGFLAGVILFL